MTDWTPADIPDLSGRTALVTGATSGLGRATVAELVCHGCEVVLAARDAVGLEAVAGEVRALAPTARVRRLVLDLADQSSVRRAAEEVATYEPLHLLVSTAGLRATPYRRTVDGFELQMAVNHLGHFALTGLLWQRLVASGDARVVSLSSQAHRIARQPPAEDPRAPMPGRYRPWPAYAASTVASLLFAQELDRRARAGGLPVRGLAAHPGYAATSRVEGGRSTSGRPWPAGIMAAALAVAGQKPEDGCLPILMAATADLPGGTYVGPGGFLGLHGPPRVVTPGKVARDPLAARRLWEVSEQATGVSFP